MKTTVLVFVRDRISGVAETQIMQLMTDVHAIKGFIEFCKKDNIAKEEHELVKIGELDEDNHFIFAKCLDVSDLDKNLTIGTSHELILCNGNNAEEKYQILTRNLREDSDLEE